MVEACATRNEAGDVTWLTGRDTYRIKFEMPTLRDVELTYPCFHDGAY